MRRSRTSPDEPSTAIGMPSTSSSEICREMSTDSVQRVSQSVDVPQSGVNIRRCANGFGRAEALEKGHRGHVAGSNRNPLFIQCARNVHRRSPLDDKGEHRYPVVGAARADEPKSWNTCKSFEAALNQCLIMSRPGVVPSFFEEANGGRKTNRPRHVGSSCLELLSAVLEFSAVELDSMSHIAADVVRRHRIQQLATSPEDACRHWPEHLVPREDVKVTSQIPNVDLHVWHALRTVHDDARSGRVRLRANLLDRIDSAEHVGDVRQRDDPRPCRRAFLRACGSRRPSSVTSTMRTVAPRSRASLVQGIRFDECSAIEMTISSPLLRFVGPHADATRLTPSVVPRTNTISDASAALIKRATVWRAAAK